MKVADYPDTGGVALAKVLRPGLAAGLFLSIDDLGDAGEK